MDEGLLYLFAASLVVDPCCDPCGSYDRTNLSEHPKQSPCMAKSGFASKMKVAVWTIEHKAKCIVEKQDTYRGFKSGRNVAAISLDSLLRLNPPTLAHTPLKLLGVRVLT